MKIMRENREVKSWPYPHTHSGRRFPWSILALVSFLGCLFAGCKIQEAQPLVQAPTRQKLSEGSAPRCAIIDTDDDIPSGSATAGALYVDDADLGKKLLTSDVVAVTKGFLDGGISCVQVIDSHDGAIDPAPLKQLGVPVLTPSNTKPWTWPFLGPMRSPVAMAAMIGYHSPAGVAGFRPHTINDSVRALRLNGKTVGEVAPMILGLGGFDIPLVLISGDMNATAEAASWVPDVEKIAVRWFGPDGKPHFLSSAEAATRLYAAARRAAASKHRPYYPAQLPIRIELEISSAAQVAHSAQTLPQDFLSLVQTEPAIKKALGSFDFRTTLKRSGRRVSWSAENRLAAFTSIAFAASYLRGPDNWEKVSEGYSAYQNGKYHLALAAYQKALKLNPYDLATYCRMAAVYLKLGVGDEALRCLAPVQKNLEEINDQAIKTWCLLELARAEFHAGRLPEAKKAADQVLALPDYRTRHQEARTILRQINEPGNKQAASSGSPRASYGEEFDFITNKLETIYSYLAIKQDHYHFSYAKLKNEFQRKISQVSQEADYQKLIAAFLGQFHDGHLRLKMDSNEATPPNLSAAVSHRWVPGRILITRIARLWGDEAEIKRQLRQGLKLLTRARALIVDLRGNGGGNDALVFDYIAKIMAQEITLGRFSLRMSAEIMKERAHYRTLYEPDPERPGFSKWRPFSVAPKSKKSFRGPIAVLINSACYSSCEGAALAFKNSGHARVYGQNTGGGSANPILIKLPRTSGMLMIPTWIQIMPDGDLLEDHGVPPDVSLGPKQDALDIALLDIRKKFL